MLLNLIQLDQIPDIRIGTHPALLTLPWPFSGLSTSYPKSNLSCFSFSNGIERETRSKEQKCGLGVRWTACGKTKSRWHWKASWRPCRRSSGGNTCMCMCMCVHAHVCACTSRELRGFLPQGQQEEERTSSSPKAQGSAKPS